MHSHMEEGGDEPNLRDVVPVALAAGAIAGTLIGSGIGLEVASPNQDGTMALVTVTAGCIAVVWMVKRALQGIQHRAVEHCRARIAHSDQIIEEMGRDIEAEDQRHAAQLAWHVAELDRREGELARLRQALEQEQAGQAAAVERARLNGMADGVFASDDERKSLIEHYEAEIERVRVEGRETFRLAIDAVLAHPHGTLTREERQALYWQVYADVLEDLSGK